MTPNQLALARKLGAIFTERDLWRPGMLACMDDDRAGHTGEVFKLRLGNKEPDGSWTVLADDGEAFVVLDGAYPDLTDWPTAGAMMGMLAEVRPEAYLQPIMGSNNNVRFWHVYAAYSTDEMRLMGDSIHNRDAPGVAVALALLAGEVELEKLRALAEQQRKKIDPPFPPEEVTR